MLEPAEDVPAPAEEEEEVLAQAPVLEEVPAPVLAEEEVQAPGLAPVMAPGLAEEAPGLAEEAPEEVLATAQAPAEVLAQEGWSCVV